MLTTSNLGDIMSYNVHFVYVPDTRDKAKIPQSPRLCFSLIFTKDFIVQLRISKDELNINCGDSRKMCVSDWFEVVSNVFKIILVDSDPNNVHVQYKQY